MRKSHLCGKFKLAKGEKTKNKIDLPPSGFTQNTTKVQYTVCEKAREDRTDVSGHPEVRKAHRKLSLGVEICHDQIKMDIICFRSNTSDKTYMRGTKLDLV